MNSGFNNSDIFSFNSTFEEQINEKELFEKLFKVIQEIQDERFPDVPEKRRILLTRDKKKIKTACVWCGDSKHNPREKRGNIHLNTMTYKCWNGDCPRSWMPLETYLELSKKDNRFSPGELTYIKKHFNNAEFSNESSSRLSINPIIKPKQIDSLAIPIDYLKKELRLYDVERNHYVYDYLKGRNQITNDNRHFLCSRLDNDVWILNLSSDKKGVFGIQVRHSNVKKTGRRFTTYQYSDIWLKLLDTEIKEEIKQKLDRISLIYNIMLVDFSKPTFIFEGPMDANHLPNSVATWSASNVIKLPHGYYFYDNTTIDKAGYKSSVDMLYEGFRVFLWKKFLEDYPHLSSCKDLDDIFKKQKFTQLELMKYFGDKAYDIIYL